MKQPAGSNRKTPGRKQVRETTSPRVNVPRQSQRPVERSKQRRSRKP